MRSRLLVLSFVAFASIAAAREVPRAVCTDPPHDKAHPARMVVLHIPSGGVDINGVAYLAQGAGPHPALVLLHGLPGNEKNLDLAQAVRRAGWNTITFNYRGSWGSSGRFRFANTLEDARAVLAYLRDPANVKALDIDVKRIVIAGHSMGGWVTAMTAAHDPALRGAILISAANMGRPGVDRSRALEVMRENAETLATTPEEGADELFANRDAFNWDNAVPGLAHVPMLVLTSDDGLASGAEALVDKLREHGNMNVRLIHVATDHSWSDRRIELETRVVRWLQNIRK